MVFRKYETSLRNLFGAFAFGTGAIGDALLKIELMDLNEYMNLINRMEIIDPFVTLREVRLVFIWSRMVIVDETTIKGRSAILQLQFEDFLEAVVRFAHMMALPCDKPESRSSSSLIGPGSLAARPRT